MSTNFDVLNASGTPLTLPRTPLLNCRASANIADMYWTLDVLVNATCWLNAAVL